MTTEDFQTELSSFVYEYLGGGGVILCGIGAFLYKWLSNKQVQCIASDTNDSSTSVLSECWEDKGDAFPQQYVTWEPHNIYRFAHKQPSGSWVVNIPQSYGNVYLYQTLTSVPEWEYNDNHHFLTCYVEDLSPGEHVYFLYKAFGEHFTELGYQPHKQLIARNGFHTFKKKSLLDSKVSPGVKYEQIGVFIRGSEFKRTRVKISHVTYGEEWYPVTANRRIKSWCACLRGVYYRKKTEQYTD